MYTSINNVKHVDANLDAPNFVISYNVCDQCIMQLGNLVSYINHLQKPT